MRPSSGLRTGTRETCCRDRSDSRRRRSSRRWCRSSAPRRRARSRVERLVITNLRGSLNSNVPWPSNARADRLRIDIGHAQRGLRVEAASIPRSRCSIDALPHGTLNAARIDPPDCGVITRSCPENASKRDLHRPGEVRDRARGRRRSCCCALTRSVREVARRPGDACLRSSPCRPTGTGGGGTHLIALSRLTLPLSARSSDGESSTRLIGRR